jgi:hypothetical protein
MGPIRCPETSVRDYHYWLRKNPKERNFLVYFVFMDLVTHSFATSGTAYLATPLYFPEG